MGARRRLTTDERDHAGANFTNLWNRQFEASNQTNAGQDSMINVDGTIAGGVSRKPSSAASASKDRKKRYHRRFYWRMFMTRCLKTKQSLGTALGALLSPPVEMHNALKDELAELHALALTQARVPVAINLAGCPLSAPASPTQSSETITEY